MTQSRCGALAPIVERFLAREPTLSDIAVHRLEPLAVASLSERRLAVSPELARAARGATAAALLAPLVLERIRRSCDGRIVLVKGAEAAAWYPDRSLRGFGDIDVLVEDAEAVHRALLAAGFRPVGNAGPDGKLHHLQPLVLPELPLPVEVHSRPNWVACLEQPDVAQLFSAAGPSATGVEGIEALSPPHHALLLAAHSWAHEPFRCLRDVLDVWCVARTCDQDELNAVARELGIRRLWSTTRRVTQAVVDGRALPLPVRFWAGNLRFARERSVFEGHLERWLSGFAILPAHRAVVELWHGAKRTILPADEPLRQKTRRSLRAITNGRRRRSEHDAEVEHLLAPPFAERRL
jgi:hypothetical protein